MIETNNFKANDIRLCLAKTRSGAPCRTPLPAERDADCTVDCRQVLGPLRAKAACVAAHWKHGRRSKAFVEARKQVWTELRRVEKEMKEVGII